MRSPRRLLLAVSSLALLGAAALPAVAQEVTPSSPWAQSASDIPAEEKDAWAGFRMKRGWSAARPTMSP